MKYYIEINSWNLLESFVTESISPFSFYQERNFGNNLSRYLSGKNEKTNHLILSTKDLGGDFSVCVDESLVDSSALTIVKDLKTVFMYPKTIYYRQGFVQFRFGSNELKDNLIAESKILLEVKTIEKYLPYFYVKTIKNVERKSITRLTDCFSFEESVFVDFDNSFNKLKGAIIGYVRGKYTSLGEPNQKLQTELRMLKNKFGGLNTQIMMSDYFDTNKEIISCINVCKELYANQVGASDYFEVLIAQIKEIENLATMRAYEIQIQNSTERRRERENLLREKTDIENQRTNIEKSYNIYEVRFELDKIKAEEKANGEANGKSRQYFKKGTVEYERKTQLKQIIDDFEKNNYEYKELNERIRQIEQKLNVNANMYDSTISALFLRVSDILNELIAKASSVTNNDSFDLSDLLIEKENLSINNVVDAPELSYFNILLDLIIHKYSETQLSEYAVLNLLLESANEFKDKTVSKSEDGQKILEVLRAYWQYKNHKADRLLLPENNLPIFQSIFSFLVKPLSYEQMDRFMLLKKFQQKEYAFMLWGAWIGFADMPKTFTNILYQNDNVTHLMDNKLEELYKW